MDKSGVLGLNWAVIEVASTDFGTLTSEVGCAAVQAPVEFGWFVGLLRLQKSCPRRLAYSLAVMAIGSFAAVVLVLRNLTRLPNWSPSVPGNMAEYSLMKNGVLERMAAIKSRELAWVK